jgi:hypothetical protein
MNGRKVVVAVSVKDMRRRKAVDENWRRYKDVRLRLVDMSISGGEKRLSVEEIVQRMELLRDAWNQLAQQNN